MEGLYSALFLVLFVVCISSLEAAVRTTPHKLLRSSTLPSVHKHYDESQHMDKAQELLQRGETIAAVLQLLENSVSQLCKRTSLADIPNFHWKQATSFGDLDTVIDVALKTANILNNYFLKAPNGTENNLDELFLYSLVKTNVESDFRVSSSSIVLPKADTMYVPYAFRRDGVIGTKTLGLSSLDKWTGNEWYWSLASRNYTDVFFRKLGSDYYATANAPWNDSIDLLVVAEDGLWTAPYYDCELATSWHVTYSAPFFAHNGNELIFRGVAAASVDMSNIDINQCDDQQQSTFSSSHHCDTDSTECVPVSGRGFRRGAYRCYCKMNYYPLPTEKKHLSEDYYDGSEIEEAFVAKILGINTHISKKYPDDFRCLPCRIGCEMCIGDSPCYVEYDMILRSMVLCFQSFCSTIVIILAVVVFRLRKSKTFSSSMWIMLETILLGALLLYQTVIIRYFEPSVLTCMLEPWFRGSGFAICYGAITLKIYRILAEFQTRKAHRVCVRDKDLLKYLMGIILVVIGYLLAWTAIIVDNMNDGYSVVAQGRTPMGLKYVMCRALWWDYVTEVGELLFLVFGVFLTYKVRNAKSDCYHEKSSLAWAIYVEALVSLLMYTIRHVVWSNLQPDYIYLLYFLRCQCTVTINLIFIYGPKLWYHHRPPDPMDYQQGRQLSSCGDVRDHMPETLKLHEAIISNGEVDFSDINLSDMDPEDIRIELRRVYTQLQVLRNITMRKGNPHISRRRGGRKGTHRRFSLQTFHHRHKHYHEQEHEVTEVSKTPEESTASVDGTPADGPSSRTEEHGSTPTVTFKEGPK